MNAKDIIAADLSAEEKATLLALCGYRRTSNAHRIISRIDRPDFVQAMAKKLFRTPAEFYVPGEDTVDGSWCDHYRRCFSNDKISGVPEDIFKLLPPSGHDSCGYVKVEGNPEILAKFQVSDVTIELLSGFQPPLADTNPEWPEKDTKWRSDKGNIFTVIGISNASPNAIYPTVNVVYQDQDDKLFSMPFSRWRCAEYLSPLPKTGSKWRHKNGNEYVVLAVTNLSAAKNKRDQYPPAVSYMRLQDGTEWTRPLSKWAGDFTAL